VLWHGSATLWVGPVTVTQRGTEVSTRHAAHLDRMLFGTPAGRPVSLRVALAALRWRRLLVAAGHSALSEGLESMGRLVLQARPGDGPWELLEALIGEAPVQAERSWCRPAPAGFAAPSLERALMTLLRRCGRPVAAVRLAHFAGGFEGVAIAQPRFGALTPLDRAGLDGGMFPRRRTLVINVDHPAVGSVLAGAEREPEAAAYLLAKMVLLPDPEDDLLLALEAWRLRCLQPTR